MPNEVESEPETEPEEPVTGKASLVSVGAGLGSFALADLLRISGLAARAIRVVGTGAEPYENLRRRLEASQVGRGDRMRSDTAARIDCPWGWPGYAMTESRRRRSVGPLLRVAAEPLLSEYFTPTAGDVYEGVSREARRISWPSMLVRAKATSIVRDPEGGYRVVLGEGGGTETIAADNVHIALGYSSERLGTALAEFRSRFPEDLRVVHAFEVHEHLYDDLARLGGRVLVQGSGITAMQEIVRILDVKVPGDRRVEVLHVARGELEGLDRVPGLSGSRKRRDGFTWQHFVFPRGAHGGQIAAKLEGSGARERSEIVRGAGSPTAPRRRSWVRRIARGARRGAYETRRADVRSIEVESDRLKVEVNVDGGRQAIEAVDWVIDATGVECSVEGNPLLASLVTSGLASVNDLGRIAVDSAFALDRNPSGGALYASGPITLGNEVAPVDSFWGLTEAAFRIVEDLSRSGVVEPIRGMRSLRAWLRWLRGAEP